MRLFLLLLLVPTISMTIMCYDRDSHEDGSVTLKGCPQGCFLNINKNTNVIKQDCASSPDGTAFPLRDTDDENRRHLYCQTDLCNAVEGQKGYGDSNGPKKNVNGTAVGTTVILSTSIIIAILILLRAMPRCQTRIIYGFLFLFGIFLIVHKWKREPTYDGFTLERGSKNEVPNFIVRGSDLNKQNSKTTKTNETSAFSRLEAQGCNIPKLELFGADVERLLKTPPPLDCDKKYKYNWVFLNEKRQLTLRKDRKDASCTLQYFDRSTDDENLVEDEVTLVEGRTMRADFAIVKCSQGWTTRWSGLLSTISKRDLPTLPKSLDRPLDVVILGVDSMSQMHFRRKLPKVVEYLEKNMDSVTLNGYNIVGDGTPQALIPILTGKTEEELPLTRKRFSNASFVDDVYPFAWGNFSRKGYVTMFGEDMYNTGTFNYRLKGFRNIPTDHYMRPFYFEVEKRDKFCIGSEPSHKVWFRYAEEFMSVYRSRPRFLFMHQGILSHDDLNLVAVQDEDMRDSIKRMHTSGDLDNAVVIVLADHGARFTDLRITHQGQMEERLPFFSISLPKSLRNTEKGRKMFENLKVNKDRLTSPFDVHAILMDILTPPVQVDEIQKTDKRSLSMLRPIPKDRSCAQAGIDPHWCTCLSWVDAFSSDIDRFSSIRIGRGVASAIDSQLREVRQKCANVTLKEVKEAKKLIPNDGLLKYKNVLDRDGFVADLSGKTAASFAFYQLKIVTKPNDAVL